MLSEIESRIKSAGNLSQCFNLLTEFGDLRCQSKLKRDRPDSGKYEFS